MPGLIKFTISIDPATNSIDIDASGKKGGNVRGKALRRVRWVRDSVTVDKFDLKFERLDDADGALSKEPDWPFLDTRAQPNPNNTDEDQGTVTGAERFSARLADAGIYKYTVTAYKGANKYVLDPAIIIDK